MGTRSKTCIQAFRSRQFGVVIAVEADLFEDEAEVFCTVSASMREKGGFGRHCKDRPFYVPVDTREQCDAARRACMVHDA